MADSGWKLLQVWFSFSLALLLRLSPPSLLLLAHLCPAWWAACHALWDDVSESRTSISDRVAIVAMLYLQMLSLWYVARRYDIEMRTAFRKHKNALRCKTTRLWPRLTRARGVRHDLFISHVCALPHRTLDDRPDPLRMHP